MPQHVPEILHEDSSVHSLNSQGSINHPNPPSYAEQQKAVEDTTQEAERKANQAADKAYEGARDFGRVAEAKAGQIERDTKKAYNDVSAEAQKDYKQVKKQAKAEGEKIKKSAKEAEQWAEQNKNNPVVMGNAVVVTALAGLIGIGAYRKYVAGELTWKVAGTWAGVVGLFAVGDYFVSS